MLKNIRIPEQKWDIPTHYEGVARIYRDYLPFSFKFTLRIASFARIAEQSSAGRYNKAEKVQGKDKQKPKTPPHYCLVEVNQ